MNMKTMVIGAIGVMVLCAGCGDRKLGEECDAEMSKRHGVMRMFENKVRTHQVLGAECEVDFNTYDELYYQCYRKSFQNSDKYISKIGSAGSFAFAKRKAALEMSREVFCYSFSNYLCLDGVSGLIYNVSYIMQIPHKMFRGLRAMDGIWRYIKSLFYLLLGFVLALVGCIIAPIVNTLCHPFETISNLLVGVVSTCADVDSPVSWIEYVFRTNIIASLWDLIWGGMIYPLWQALIFWL